MRATWISLSVCLGLVLLSAWGARANEPKKQASYKVIDFVLAKSVDFDAEGHCRTRAGRLKAWRLPAFPAKIPHFETCFTVKAKADQGMLDFTLSVVDGKGKDIQSVDGVLDSGVDGQATQVVEWEHLNIPAAGKYRMVVEVKGKKAGSFPMRFVKR
jgi:hypothetical protein